jgi:ceramide synthetase
MLMEWNRLKLKVLYGFAGGFYTYSIFALMFWETRRADFGVSMSHHIAAVFLVIFSYLARFFSSYPHLSAPLLGL